MRKMHDRNIYKVPPDFRKLAEQYEKFGKHVTVSLDGKGHLNFKDPQAVRELTYTLLKHDFGLSLEVPLDRLIPTVPLRLNYILWVEDLLKESSLGKDPIKGVDIGCGASCIYPLLGAKINNWIFIASEPDDDSYIFAEKNIELNNLTPSILLTRGNPDTLLKDVIDKNDQYDFCMCNPPFFNDREEAAGLNSRTDNRALPHSVCTATDEESITDGGEVTFVKKIIQESIELKHTVRWYTSMLGKKKSLRTLNRYLTEQKIPFVTHTVFQQGKTTRWGIGWSFYNKIKHPKKLSPTGKVNPLPFAFVVSKSEMEKRYSEEKYCSLDENGRVKLVFSEIVDLLNYLKVSYSESSTFNACGGFEYLCVGEAWRNTWSHQRQRRRLEKRLKVIEHDSRDANIAEAGLGGSCRVSYGEDCSERQNSAVGYLMGREAGESLCDKSSTCSCLDSGYEKIVGHKRVHSPVENEESVDCAVPMFKFTIKSFVNRESASMETEPVKVEVSCLEGNREGLHQLFMFLRNKLNGIQRSQQKK